MEQVVIKASRRNVIGKQVRALRREGKIPAVIYGRYIEPLSIELDLRDITNSLHGLAPSAIVKVDVEGVEHQALVREKQRDNIKGTLTHIDFLAVSMEDILRAHVSVELFGLSPAIKDFNGILVTGTNELEVECLPRDLPERIRVDVSVLKKIGEAIYVRDIQLSEAIRILNDPDTMVALVTGQEAEEVVEEAAAVEPEVIEKGKKEEEEL